MSLAGCGIEKVVLVAGYRDLDRIADFGAVALVCLDADQRACDANGDHGGIAEEFQRVNRCRDLARPSSRQRSVLGAEAERHATREAELAAAHQAERDATLARLREEAEREQRIQNERLAGVTSQLEAANGEIQRLHGMLSSLEAARAAERQEVIEIVEELPAAPKPRFARRFLDPIYWALTFQFRARMRERRVVERLRESGLVDVRYYRRNYRDIDDKIDPVEHYVRHGAAEGRNPNDRFDTEFYLATNPDVASGTLNPLDHFNCHGWRERRNPHPMFAVGPYLDANPDVLESGMNPLQHFLSHGRRERRPTAPPPAQSERSRH